MRFKRQFFTFSSRWIFISLRFSHFKGVTFYRLYEIKSVPDRKEMSQRSSVPTQIRDIYHFQRTVQFRHRSLQSLLSMYSMVCWWQISYEYGFHLNGKRFLEVYVKNHWKADRLASFKFLWDPVWLSGESTPEAPCSQIRILKFSKISLRQKSLPTWTGQEQALTSCV